MFYEFWLVEIIGTNIRFDGTNRMLVGTRVIVWLKLQVEKVSSCWQRNSVWNLHIHLWKQMPRSISIIESNVVDVFDMKINENYFSNFKRIFGLNNFILFGFFFFCERIYLCLLPFLWIISVEVGSSEHAIGLV